jgi:NTP pyrophosphatase (non-canonical NTP hydrolase)
MLQVRDLEEIKTRLREFAEERNWQKFHTPRNLVVALASEAGELLAEFRWQTIDANELSVEELDRIKSEIADIAIFLVRLCDVLDVDLAEVITAKLEQNANRPVDGPNLGKP